ncbi:MAG: MBL fold metallo-hydrolase [Magnetococcales bacterium]|nr:MBL fold metallo-hydrolase [Magnetococcales bacterium]
MSRYQETHAGVTRIDVEYVRPGFTAAWLVRERGRAVFVETGPLPAVPLLLGALTRHGLSPGAVEAIIVTHVHLDHAGGAGELLRHLPNARLLVHPSGLQHLVDPSRLIAGAKVVYGEERFMATLGGAVPVDPARVHCPADGETFSLAGRPLTLLETPGHSLNHLCVFDEASRSLFTGDAFGLSYRELDGIGRPFFLPATTPTQFDPQSYQETVRRLAALGPARLCLTHFGSVPWMPVYVDDLERQLEVYRQLAMETNEKMAHDALVAALRGDLRERLGGTGVEPLLDLLAMDLDLNAQGLAVWRERQGRRAAT